jgi:hypothetical protein
MRQLLPPGAVVLAALVAPGCAADQMKFTALRTAARVPEIQQAEVMHNLARVAENPGAMPYLSRPFNGTASATDTASGVTSLTGQSHQYTLVNYGLSTVMRAVQSNIGLNVVDDPDKLAAMHIAYRLVTAPRTVSQLAIDSCLAPYRSGNHPCVEAIPPGCWLRVGGKHDVPRCAAASAHSGGTYVWVMPEDLESLTRFTYLILNIATLKSDRMAAVPTATGPGTFGAAPAPGREENPVFNPNLLLIPRP